MNYKIILQDENGQEIVRTYTQSYFLNNDKEDIGKNVYDMFVQLMSKNQVF